MSVLDVLNQVWTSHSHVVDVSNWSYNLSKWCFKYLKLELETLTIGIVDIFD